ncbi:MAG TPA: FAD:protein FMN transferase [Burkholderiales bacterium]|nr:FAD:protein FMN transferase [Burkholderiales bacterium]
MKSSSSSVSRARPLLGTLVEIRISADCADPAVAIGEAFSTVERVHQLMSAQDPESDVSRINRAADATALRIDPWTSQVLARAKAIHAATEGLFDCAVAAQVCAQGSSITLDGIAKGYAVDRAVESLRASGVPWGVVNAGGDLRLFGERAHTVHVRDPRSPGEFLRLGPLCEVAVASSAAYFENSALVDPRRRKICEPVCGVTVIANDCATADALTKPCLLEPNRAHEFARALDAHAMVIRLESRP